MKELTLYYTLAQSCIQIKMRLSSLYKEKKILIVLSGVKAARKIGK